MNEIPTERYQGRVPIWLALLQMSALGVTPIGFRKNGEPIWPMAGGDGTPLHEQSLDAFRTVDELTEHRSALSHRLSAIVAEAGGKPLADEAKAEFAAIKELIEGQNGVDERIAEQKFLLDTVARLGADPDNTEAGADPLGASPTTTVRRPGQPIRTSVARRADAPRRVPQNLFDLGAYRAVARSAQDEQALMRDGARFALDDMSFYNPRVDPDAQREYIGGLFATMQGGPDALARHILAVGSEDYLRAFVLKLAEKPLDAAAERAMQIAAPFAMELSTGSAGGFAVPVQLDPTLLPTTDGVINELRTIARVERITGEKFQLVTSGGVTVRRGLEGTPMVASEPVLGRPEIATVQVDVFVPFSFALGLAWQGILPALAGETADAFDVEEASSFIYGDGTDEEPGGLLTTMPDASRIETIALSDTDLYGITGSHANRLGPRFLARARWLGATGIYNEIRAFASDSDGSSLWARLAEGTPPGLLNKPTHEQSTMPFSSEGGTDETDDYLVLGDFSNFLIVDRIGTTVEVAQHLFRQAVAGAGYGVPTGQRGFIAHRHNNARIIVPNAFRVLTRKNIGS
jgi:HK97 family phage major capsid protein